MLMLLWKHRYPTYLLPNFAHTLLLWPYVSCRRTLDIGPWLVAEYKCWIQKKLMARGAWVHKLYALYYSDLKIDRHSFPGDVSLRFWFFKPRHWPAHWHFCCAQECMIGFVYAGESGAEKFIRKVDSKKRFRYRWERCPKKKKTHWAKTKLTNPWSQVLKSGSSKHIAHMGYEADTEWSSESVDSSWVALLKDLEGEGVSRQSIQQEIEYIKPFVRDAQDAPKRKTKPQPPPAPHCRSHVPGTSTDVQLQVKPPLPSPAPMNRQYNS